MVLALLLLRLHAAICFVGLDVAAAQQIARHPINNGDEQLAHAQHRIVDRAQRHIHAGIAPQHGLLTKQGQAVGIFADDEFDDGLIGEDRFRRDARKHRGRGHALFFALGTGALLAQKHGHIVLGRLHGQHFSPLVADDLFLFAALATSALLGRARDDLVDPFQMRWKLVAAGMLLAGARRLCRSCIV